MISHKLDVDGARLIVGEADGFLNFLRIAHVAIDTDGDGIFWFECL